MFSEIKVLHFHQESVPLTQKGSGSVSRKMVKKAKFSGSDSWHGVEYNGGTL